MGVRTTTRFKRRRAPVVKVGIFFGILFMVVVIMFFAFQIRDMQIGDSNYYSQEELETYFVKNVFDRNTFVLFAKLKFGKKIDIPFIQKYDVVLEDGHSIRIKVYDKSIAGCVMYMGEYIYFDKDGMVLEINQEKMEGVPLITGVHFSQMKLYDRLAVEDEKVFATVMNLSQLIKRYAIRVDKVVFDAYQKVSLNIDGIKVLLGKNEKYDEQIAELSSIISKLEGRNGELFMENFTPGQDKIVFKEYN